MQNPELPRLLKRKEAARTLSISERKLFEMTKSKEIPHLTIGRSVRYPANELAAWIASKTNNNH